MRTSKPAYKRASKRAAMQNAVRTAISLALAAVLTVSLLGCVQSSEKNATTGGLTNDLTMGISNPGVNKEALAMDSPVPLVPVSRPAGNATSEQPSQEYLANVSAFSYSTAGTILAATPENENTNYSPISLWFALSALGLAAQGQTEQELLGVMGVTSRDQLASEGNRLFGYLSFKSETGSLRLANSIWLNQNISYEQSYLDNAAKSLYLEGYQQDFSNPDTGKKIGRWVADNTEGLLAPSIEVNGSEAFHILNTVYFADSWSIPFKDENTADDNFYLPQGVITVPFLNDVQDGSVSYGKGFTWGSLQLRERGFHMDFVLPDEGKTVKDLVGDGSSVEKLLSGGTSSYGIVTWKIPKFSFGTQYEDLVPLLKAKGIEKAFNPQADFGALSQEAFVSKVIQETYILVDERGAKAAAYTDVAAPGAAPGEPKRFEMILDRPFLFALYGPGDTLLFIGICNNPLEG